MTIYIISPGNDINEFVSVTKGKSKRVFAVGVMDFGSGSCFVIQNPPSSYLKFVY